MAMCFDNLLKQFLMQNEKLLKMPQQNDLASFALSSDCWKYAYNVEEVILVLGETEHGQKNGKTSHEMW